MRQSQGQGRVGLGSLLNKPISQGSTVQAQHMTAKVSCYRDPSLGAEPRASAHLLGALWSCSLWFKHGMGREEEAGISGDPTEVEHHSNLRGLRTHPAFPGGRAGSPLVLTGGLCGEGVGDGDGDEEKDRDLGNKENVRKKSGAWQISLLARAGTSPRKQRPQAQAQLLHHLIEHTLRENRKG